MSHFIKQPENMKMIRQISPDHLWHIWIINDHLRQHTNATRNIRTVLNKPEWETWARLLKELSLYGWYLVGDITIDQFREVSALLKQGNISELDQRMMQLIEHNWDKITKAILHRHPGRRLPLEQAFIAHKNEFYFLSIPVLFAQIDGLCEEGSGEKFFLNRRTDDNEHVPRIRNWALREQRTIFHKAISAPLLDKGAFQLHSSQANCISITRHSVLHGEVSDYGTKINSLKAISLLIYIAETCFE